MSPFRVLFKTLMFEYDMRPKLTKNIFSILKMESRTSIYKSRKKNKLPSCLGIKSLLLYVLLFFVPINKILYYNILEINLVFYLINVLLSNYYSPLEHQKN